MNLEALRAEVRANIERTASGLSDIRLTQFINWAIEEIAGLFTFTETQRIFTGNTIIGQRRYGYPERMKDIYSLVLDDDANSRKLEYKVARNFDTNQPWADGYSGVPSIYIDYGTNLELWVVPDAAYPLVLRCSQYPALLVEDVDEPSLVRKDRLIVTLATAIGWEVQREEEDAKAWRQKADRLMSVAIRANGTPGDWVPVQRPSSPSALPYINTPEHSSPFYGRHG